MTSEIRLRPPTQKELEKARGSPVFGMLVALDLVVPWDEATTGCEFTVPANNESIKRSIRRSSAKAGFRSTVIEEDSHYTRWRCEEITDQRPSYPNLNKYQRSWDKALPQVAISRVRDRRREPDGEERRVTKKRIAGGKVINIYPWSKMIDGDFFVVPMNRGTDREERALRNAFRESSCRHDFEIAVTRVSYNDHGEEKDAMRCTRVYGGLEQLKLDAGLVASRGRRKAKSTGPRQSTLDRRAVEALIKSGFSEDQAWDMLNANKENRNAEHGNGNGSAGVPTPVQGGERDAREEHRQDRGYPGRGSRALQEGDVPDRGGNRRVREVVNVFDTGGDEDSEAYAPEGGESDGGGEVPLFEVRPDAPEQSGSVQERRGNQPRSVPEGNARPKSDTVEPAGGVSEIRVLDGETLDPARLKGTAYDPEYDRAAIMRARIAKLAGEE